MQITPTSHHQVIEISEDEKEMNALIGYGEETLTFIPKDEINDNFVFTSRASGLLSEIHNCLPLIFSISRTNQNLLITLIYKVGFIAKKLSELSSSNTILAPLKTDYETLHKKMSNLRILKSGKLTLTTVEELDQIIFSLMIAAIYKSDRNFDSRIISRLRVIYQTHDLDVFAKDFSGTEHIQANYNNFIQKVAEKIDFHRPKSQLGFVKVHFFDKFIKEEQESLFQLITYYPIGEIALKIDFEKITKCTKITSIKATFMEIFDSLPNPVLLKSLQMCHYFDFGDKLSSLVNLESLGILSSGSLNALPHPEKLKYLKIQDFKYFPDPCFWAKCTSLEKIKLVDNFYRRTFDLSPLPKPEKLKILKIGNTTLPDLTPFTQLEELHINTINNLEQTNTISNSSKLKKLKVSLWGFNEITQFFDNIVHNGSLKTLTLLYSFRNHYNKNSLIFNITKIIAKDLTDKYPKLTRINHNIDLIKFEDDAKEIFFKKNIVVTTSGRKPKILGNGVMG